MRQSVRLGRVAGIDIGAHWSVLVIAVLLGYGLAVSVLRVGAPGQPIGAYVAVASVVAVLFLAGLLAHELAHALVARRYGVGVRRITLWLLGGVSELEGEPPTPRSEFLLAAAGPLTSLVIGGVAAAGAVVAEAAGASRLIAVALVWLAGVNLLLGVFNLLPGAPLDGGRIAHAVVWRLRGDRDRAQVAADRAGVALGVLLAAVGLAETFLRANISGLWLVLLGWFLVRAANAETASVRLHRALDGRTVRDIMVADPIYGNATQSVDSFVAATATPHPHGSYPVVDDDRRPIGLVHLEDLARIPPAERSRVPLRAAVTPAAAKPTVAADEPAVAAVRSLSPASPLLAVTDHEQLVGVVGTGDVEHAVLIATIRHNGTTGGQR